MTAPTSKHWPKARLVVDQFSYAATDGMLDIPAELNITVTGINDAPEVSTDTGQVVEDGTLFIAGNVLANDSDVDSGTILTVATPGVYASQHGTLVIDANGDYTYNLNNESRDVQALAQDSTITDQFTYAASDGIVTVSANLDITVTGTNDAPIVTADNAPLSEDQVVSANGNVLANDADIDNGTVLTVTNPGDYQGSYGTLSLAADGCYTYNLDNDSSGVQSLGRGQMITESFNYTVTDSIAEATSSLEILLQGTNDAPILTVPMADQQLTFNKPFSWQMQEGSFTDIDQGDTLTYTATLADGSGLPDWLTFDADTQTFSGWTPKQVGEIEVQVTAADQVAATGSTENSLSASDFSWLRLATATKGWVTGRMRPQPGKMPTLMTALAPRRANPARKIKPRQR